MSKDDCIFCKMVAGQVPVTKIYEDEVVLAFLDIGPVSDGHTLVIPKEHFVRLDECPEAVITSVARKLGAVATAIIQAVQADAYNIVNNNGRSAGQLIDHIHFHIIPRRSGDGVIRYSEHSQYPPGRLEELAQLIRQSI